MSTPYTSSWSDSNKDKKDTDSPLPPLPLSPELTLPPLPPSPDSPLPPLPLSPTASPGIDSNDTLSALSHLPLPPSGAGASELTAKYTPALLANPSQSYYTVHRQLDVVKWLRCTHTEALYYINMGYRVYKANEQTFRPIASTVDVEPGAFYSQFEEAFGAENVLEGAGMGAGGEEVMGGESAADGPDASSGSSSSGKGDGVFDRPEGDFGDEGKGKAKS